MCHAFYKSTQQINATIGLAHALPMIGRLATCAGALGKTLTELLNAAARINRFLLTRVKRVAARAHIKVQIDR